MNYTYYQEVQSNVHHLYAREICDYLGIYSESGKPHVKFFVTVYDSNAKDARKLYYKTSKGLLSRVYHDRFAVYKFIDLIKDNINGVPENTMKLTRVIKYNDKCYIVKIDVQKFKEATSE